MTDVQLILIMPASVIVGHLIGFTAVFLLIRLDRATRSDRPRKVAPLAV